MVPVLLDIPPELLVIPPVLLAVVPVLFVVVPGVLGVAPVLLVIVPDVLGVVPVVFGIVLLGEVLGVELVVPGVPAGCVVFRRVPSALRVVVSVCATAKPTVPTMAAVAAAVVRKLLRFMV